MKSVSWRKGGTVLQSCSDNLRTPDTHHRECESRNGPRPSIRLLSLQAKTTDTGGLWGWDRCMRAPAARSCVRISEETMQDRTEAKLGTASAGAATQQPCGGRLAVPRRFLAPGRSICSDTGGGACSEASRKERVADRIMLENPDAQPSLHGRCRCTTPSKGLVPNCLMCLANTMQLLRTFPHLLARESPRLGCKSVFTTRVHSKWGLNRAQGKPRPERCQVTD